MASTRAKKIPNRPQVDSLDASRRAAAWSRLSDGAVRTSGYAGNPWQDDLLRIARDCWSSGNADEAIQLAGLAMLRVRDVKLYRDALLDVLWWTSEQIEKAVRAVQVGMATRRTKPAPRRERDRRP